MGSSNQRRSPRVTSPSSSLRMPSLGRLCLRNSIKTASNCQVACTHRAAVALETVVDPHPTHTEGPPQPQSSLRVRARSNVGRVDEHIHSEILPHSNPRCQTLCRTAGKCARVLRHRSESGLGGLPRWAERWAPRPASGGHGHRLTSRSSSTSLSESPDRPGLPRRCERSSPWST